MSYEIEASSATPRLLVLLTDELEESVKVVNRIIDAIIQLNYDGDAPKNRYFISVIGFNHNLKDLCSGWLKDLDASPLRYEALKKKTPDGAGGIVEVEVLQPVWVESMENSPVVENYVHAINLTKELVKLWVKQEKMSPIIIDCSTKCYAENSIEEIRLLKQISAIDGTALFFGSYSEVYNNSNNIFSKMPLMWQYRFKSLGMSENDYCNGLFCREHIFTIIGGLFDRGSE